MRFHAPLQALLPLLLSASPASAIILFNLDNSANQTDPGSGVPWTSVGRVQSAGAANQSGSAVYLGNGYVLTANHVATTAFYNEIEFGAGLVYQLDQGYTPVQVADGVDLKVVRLLDHNPAGVTAATLFPTFHGEEVAPATLIGWGRGRNATFAPGTPAGNWGDDTTRAKRWGLNEPKAATLVNYSNGGFTYNYETLVTIAGAASGTPAGLGDSEATLTSYDSGGGIFQLIGGQWYLIGISVAVEVNGYVTFGNDDTVSPRGDASFFARVSTYESQISALVPEPSAWAALAGLGALGLVCLRRRS